MKVESRFQCLNLTCEAEATCRTCLWCPKHCPCISPVDDCPPWDAFVIKKPEKIKPKVTKPADSMLWSDDGDPED